MANFSVNHSAEDFSRRNALYTQDHITAFQASHKFNGNIAVTPGKPHLRMVDHAVLVESVDERTRKLANNYFTNRMKQTSNEVFSRQISLREGIAVTVLGSLGAGLAMMTFPYSIPLILGEIGLGMIYVKKLSDNRKAVNGMLQDLDQLKVKKEQWVDPIDQVVIHRRRAGVEGFKYIFNNNLKNTIVHPKEIGELWIRDVSQMVSNPIDITQIFKDDLLGQKCMDYAWNGQSLPELHIGERSISSSLLRHMAQHYQECRLAYQQFQSQINHEMHKIETERSTLLAGIAALRSHWLIPAQRIQHLGLQEIETLRDRSLEMFILEKRRALAEVEREYHDVIQNPHDPEELMYQSRLNDLRREATAQINREYHSHPGVIAIEKAYERDKFNCTLLYNQAKNVVDLFFDQRIHQLNSEASQARQQIEKQAKDGENFYSNILKKIFHADNESSLNNITPVRIEVLGAWKFSNLALEPSWNDVYTRLPRFQPSLSESLSEDIWSFFWGNNGIGRFASSPMRSWDQVLVDRSLFPSRQTYLNLHRIPLRLPKEKFFLRPIIIPRPLRPSVRVQVGKQERREHASSLPSMTRPAAPIQRDQRRVNVGQATTIETKRREQESSPPSMTRPAPSIQRDQRRVNVGQATTIGTKRREQESSPPSMTRPAAPIQRDQRRVNVGQATTIGTKRR